MPGLGRRALANFEGCPPCRGVFCEGLSCLHSVTSRLLGKYVLLGQTHCVTLAGADKKGTKNKGAEILIKIAAFAIKSDSGESGAIPLLLFLGGEEVGKKSGERFPFFHLRGTSPNVIATCVRVEETERVAHLNFTPKTPTNK